MKKIKRFRIVKKLLLFFIVCLFLSGLTAIPIEWQLSQVLKYVPADGSLHVWLQKVLAAYGQMKQQAPFLVYGYDWLAFAHFVLAILFIGAYRDPLKNIWVIEFGMIACALVIPFAFVAGHFRSIPVGWRFIDCSFGVTGFIVLLVCYRQLQYIFFSSKTKYYHESF